MLCKLLIWTGYSLMILCVGGVVVFAALGMIPAAIASACLAVLLAFMCRRESDHLNEWRARHHDRAWRDSYRHPQL
ncbi:hypothetical protein [Luteolibacter marinus]|uniref:hypothetical protein n=1 Tax=Luteolibacter marinus TaxID=2776705 RepID=UPI00186770C1|nr:hypothetical protein [Luteolibacter marinus]